MKTKIRVLFLQAGTEGEAIEDVHSILAREFDRDHIEIYIACDICINGEKTPTRTYRMFEAIPDLHIRPTNFGQPIPLLSLSQNRSKLVTAKNVLFTGLALSGSMAGLIRYIKQHRIDIVHAGRYRDINCGALLARLTGVKCMRISTNLVGPGSPLFIIGHCGKQTGSSPFRSLPLNSLSQ